MKKINFLYFSLFLILLISCVNKEIKTYNPDNDKIIYSGRIDKRDITKPQLVSSGDAIQFNIKGQECKIQLNNIDSVNYNYISLVVDDIYDKRIKITGDTTIHIITAAKKRNHNIYIYKATEAQNGTVEFTGISCMKLLPVKKIPGRKIEFIGNSITCGMGVEWEEIACDSGTWYDQHNAYWAYGPRVSRKLNAQYVLSSVSGIGVYRNWNSDEPTMPQVYTNNNLDTDTLNKYDITRYIPDLVSICIGHNDFSLGDGITPRDEFDSAKFVSNYIAFMKTIHNYYPKAKICLLQSPMLTSPYKEMHLRYINIAESILEEELGNNIFYVYAFKQQYNSGCTTHPDKKDQEMITAELLPFYKEVMNWD